MKPFFFLPLAALFSATLHASSYDTSFEGPEFGTGGVHQQSGWSARYSDEPDLCTIIESGDALVPAPDGVQMLSIVRPTIESRPAAGVIFHEEPTPLTDFTASWQLAYRAQSSFPLFQVEIGSAADSTSGVHLGIGFFDIEGKRSIRLFHGRNQQRKPIPMPESSDSRTADPLSFYEFELRVHDGGKLYDITVKQNDEVVAAVSNQPVAVAAENYNRLIVSIPGGSQGDQLLFDLLKIEPM